MFGHREPLAVQSGAKAALKNLLEPLTEQTSFLVGSAVAGTLSPERMALAVR